MKPIDETHPSLKRYMELFRILCTIRRDTNWANEDFVEITEEIDREVQKHTVDKAVLKKCLDSWINHYEKHFEMYGEEYDKLQDAVELIKKELGLEEE